MERYFINMGNPLKMEGRKSGPKYKIGDVTETRNSRCKNKVHLMRKN